MPIEHDVKDLSLATGGVIALSGQSKEMPVLRKIRERFAKGKAASGHAHLRLPACHHRNRQPDAHAPGRRGRVSCFAPPTRYPPRMM
jgi:S-adenosylhomocysteine hydrolase